MRHRTIMARPRKEVQQTAVEDPRQMHLPLEESPMDKAINATPGPIDIDKMEFNTIGDYVKYNKEARRLNKLYRICRYPIKPCPIELHPKERIVFGRNDQPTNPLPVYKSDDMIDFKMTLEPGKTYDLPVYIVDYLSKKGTPVWKWKSNTDGSRETFVDHYAPRFAIRTVYAR